MSEAMQDKRMKTHSQNRYKFFGVSCKYIRLGADPLHLSGMYERRRYRLSGIPWALIR